MALALVVGIHGDIIDPAAMAVMAHQDAGDDHPADGPQQHRPMPRGPAETNILIGVVMRNGQAGSAPQGDDILDIAVTGGADLKLWHYSSLDSSLD